MKYNLNIKEGGFMKAYVYSFKEEPWNDDCRLAVEGFKKLNIPYTLFSTNEELNKANKKDIIVGGLLITTSRLLDLGIKTPNINYPHELLKYTERKIWESTLKDLYKQKTPFFIKPLDEKLIQAKVINKIEDLDEYTVLDADTRFICSEVVEFVSEYRCFIRYNRLFDVRIYKGNIKDTIDLDVVYKAINDYKTSPKAYVLDFGLTSDGRTILIEFNDGFSLGAYGMDCEKYACFLMTRWSELVGSDDPMDYKYPLSFKCETMK